MKGALFFQKGRHLVMVIAMLLVFFVCASCTILHPETERLTITATIFPQYDIARFIVGDKAHCEMLITPGADSHSYDPSVSDIIMAKKSDLFIYTGVTLEPWTKSLVTSLPANVTILDVFVELEKNDDFSPLVLEHLHDDDERDSDHHHHDHEYDPHIWTNPKYVMMIAQIIGDAVSSLDPANQQYYQSNVDLYIKQFEKIDEGLTGIRKKYIENGQKSIYFVAPFAFAYTFREYFTPYSIHFYTVYDTCSIEIAPSINDIINMNKMIKENNIGIVYLKELILNTKIAEKIIENTDAKISLLHSGNNVSREDFKNKVTLYEIWLNNILVLEGGSI